MEEWRLRLDQKNVILVWRNVVISVAIMARDIQIIISKFRKI